MHADMNLPQLHVLPSHDTGCEHTLTEDCSCHPALDTIPEVYTEVYHKRVEPVPANEDKWFFRSVIKPPNDNSI